MNTNTISPNITVLTALNRTLERLKTLTDPVENKLQLKLLIAGAQIDAKVVAVFNIRRVRDMISQLGKFITKQQLENGNWYYRFELGRNYTAFSPYARVDDLYAEFKHRIEQFGLLVEIRPNTVDDKVTFKLHAPRIIPRKTNNISFILNKDETELVEWFPGNLPEASTITAAGLRSGELNLGSQWVRLGSYNPPKDGQPHYKKNAHKVHQPAGLADLGAALQQAVDTKAEQQHQDEVRPVEESVALTAPVEDLVEDHDAVAVVQ